MSEDIKMGSSRGPADVPTGQSQDEDKKTDPARKKDQPKGNHTIFIHKLYNMLEDSSIRHLIWWSDTHDSFFLIPSEEFCKVLLTYFKHSNVASFVRQLNMYGFHKVNDNSSDKEKKNKSYREDSVIPATKWEFSHSSRNFRKGDFDGLKNIRRRSSKNPNIKDKQNSSEDNLKSLTDTKKLKEQDEPYNTAINNPSEPYPYSSGFTKNDDIPMLNMKLSELSYNLAAIRHEHARLQLQYDSTVEDLKHTNLDMVHLLDIVQKLVSQSKDQMGHPDTTLTLEHELGAFRSCIMQRAAAFDSSAPPHQPLFHTLQRSRFSSHDKRYSVSQPAFKESKYHPGPSRSESPFSASANTNTGLDNNGQNPFKYVVSNPQSQPATPFYAPKQPTSAPANAPANASAFQTQSNPFLNDVTFSSNSTNKSRTMSILCDPLAPEPGFNTSGTNLPSTESKLTTGMVSPESSQAHLRQSGYFSSISSVRTSEGALPFAYHAHGGMYYNGAYPPYDTSEKPNKEALLSKRHSSNDVLFDRSRNSDSSNSQLTITFVSAPRSVPDLYNSIPGAGRQLASQFANASERSSSVTPTLPSLHNLLESARVSPKLPTSNLPSHLTVYTPRPHLSHTNSPKNVSLPAASLGVYSLLNHDDKTRTDNGESQHDETQNGRSQSGSKSQPPGSDHTKRDFKRMKLESNSNE